MVQTAGRDSLFFQTRNRSSRRHHPRLLLLIIFNGTYSKHNRGSSRTEVPEVSRDGSHKFTNFCNLWEHDGIQIVADTHLTPAGASRPRKDKWKKTTYKIHPKTARAYLSAEIILVDGLVAIFSQCNSRKFGVSRLDAVSHNFVIAWVVAVSLTCDKLTCDKHRHRKKPMSRCKQRTQKNRLDDSMPRCKNQAEKIGLNDATL